jgi:hypothetical protein
MCFKPPHPAPLFRPTKDSQCYRILFNHRDPAPQPRPKISFGQPKIANVVGYCSTITIPPLSLGQRPARRGPGRRGGALRHGVIGHPVHRARGNTGMHARPAEGHWVR